MARLCLADTYGKHTVISLMGAGKYHAILQSAGIDVNCLNFLRRRITLSGLWGLWRILRDTRPDVVQTWMYHADLVGGVMARLAGHRNLVWGIRHSDLNAGSTARSTILVARLSGFVPRVIVCCAKKSRKVHVALGYYGARMRVIPNGCDLSVFLPDPALGQGFRAQIGVASDVALIGFVARFDPQKDHLNLLNALAQVRQRGQGCAAFWLARVWMQVMLF